jgi:hypothetical protein
MHKRVSLATGLAVANLLRETLATHPPLEQPLLMATNNNMRIGHYLLSLGYITPQHLVNALSEQHDAFKQGQLLMLGDIFVRSQLVHPRVLTTVLLVQLIDRMLDPQWEPTRLGEQLVVSGDLELLELAPAFQLQTWLRQSGSTMPLGDLLVQQDKLTHQRLANVLATQRHHTHDTPLPLQRLHEFDVI